MMNTQSNYRMNKEQYTKVVLSNNQIPCSCLIKRGCYGTLTMEESQTYKKCLACREKDAIKDQKRKENRELVLHNNSINDNKKKCAYCKNIYELRKFINRNTGKETKKCLACRDLDKKHDMNRSVK